MKYIVCIVLVLVALAWLCQASYIHPDVPTDTSGVGCVGCPEPQPLEAGANLVIASIEALVVAVVIIAALFAVGAIGMKIIDLLSRV